MNSKFAGGGLHFANDSGVSSAIQQQSMRSGRHGLGVGSMPVGGSSLAGTGLAAMAGAVGDMMGGDQLNNSVLKQAYLFPDILGKYSGVPGRNR